MIPPFGRDIDHGLRPFPNSDRVSVCEVAVVDVADGGVQGVEEVWLCTSRISGSIVGL